MAQCTTIFSNAQQNISQYTTKYFSAHNKIFSWCTTKHFSVHRYFFQRTNIFFDTGAKRKHVCEYVPAWWCCHCVWFDKRQVIGSLKYVLFSCGSLVQETFNFCSSCGERLPKKLKFQFSSEKNMKPKKSLVPKKSWSWGSIRNS